MTEKLADKLRGASRDVLDEIVREAESRLAAQLSTAVAADMRAMTFLGFLSAVIVATIGYALTTFDSNSVLSLIALFCGCGFLCGAAFAYRASRPIDFEFVGNNPDQWVEDIEKKASLHDSLAEQAEHYNAMLHQNRKAMAASGQALHHASMVVMVTVLATAVLVVGYMTGLIPR